MDEGLFKKYSRVLTIKKNEKEEIIVFIQQEINVTLKNQEITIHKKKVSFQVSSVTRTLLKKKNIYEFLHKKGYSFTL